VLSLMTYAIPGLVIDTVYLLVIGFQKRWLMVVPAALGNVSGSILVGIVFMHLPFVPLVIGVVFAFIFGAIGGWLSLFLHSWLIETFPILNKSD